MYPDIPDPEDIRNDDILTHLLSMWVEGGDDIYIPDRAQNELAKIVASTYEDVYRQYFPDDKELANYDAFWLEENLSMNVPTSDGTPLREKMLREVFNTELEGSIIVNVGNKMKANIGYLHEQALKRASSAITGAKTVGQLQSLLLLSNKPTLAGIIAQAAEQRMDIGTTMSNVFERVIGGMPTFKPTFIGREGKPVDSNFKRFIQNLAQGGARAKSPIDTQIIDRDLSELPPAIQDKMSVELGESDPDVIADRPFLDRKGNIIFPRLFTPGGRLRTAGTIHTPLEKQMQGYQPLTITPVERAPLKAALEILIDKRDLPPSPS